MIRVCLCGLGRTGTEIARLFSEQDDIKIVSAICSELSPKSGRDLGELTGCSIEGVTVQPPSELERVILKTLPNVAVDFSTPAAAMANSKMFAKWGVNVVMGTTGFSKMALKRLFVLARRSEWGIVYAPNITLGVNVMMVLSNIASNMLPGYDFVVTEHHHSRKKDAPSGTALKLADNISRSLKASGAWNYNVPINSVRAGGMVGRHELVAAGENDQVSISHESYSRRAFALGALVATRFIAGKNGWYEMSDVLGIKDALRNCLLNEERNILRRKMKYKREYNLEVV